MSYDLLVFDKERLPRDREGFLKRYTELVSWEDITDPSCISPQLRAFWDRISVDFPPINAPRTMPDHSSSGLSLLSKIRKKFTGNANKAPMNLSDDFDESCFTDYTFTPDGIYMAFAWSVSEKALAAVVAAAIETGVGFFDVSAANGAVLHDRNQLLAFIKQIPQPQKATLSKSDIFRLLSDTGWTVVRDKDDGSRYATLTEHDRIIRVLPTISQSSRGTRIDWRDGICSKNFAKAISIIGARSEAFHPMVLRNGKCQIANQLTLQDVKCGLGELLENARETDLDCLLDDVLKLPTSAPGHAPLRLLAAMVCKGSFFELIEMRDKMKAGDRMGFVPYIQLEHLERALEAYRINSDDGKITF